MEQHIEETKLKMQELVQDLEFLPGAALKPNLMDIRFAVKPTNTHWVPVKVSNNGGHHRLELASKVQLRYQDIL